MKSLRLSLAALAAFCLMSVAAIAADAASPAGTWKYTQAGRGGAPGMERTLMLDYKDGKLTGTLKGATMGQMEIPDTAIADGSFTDGSVSFTVTVDMGGNKRTTKYTAKLDGDTLTGSTEAPGRDGAPQKRDFKATRAAASKM
jgi:hypothetical protein